MLITFPHHREQRAVIGIATGRVDRCTGGPLLGLDPNKRYMVFPGAHMTKDALGRHTISYA